MLDSSILVNNANQDIVVRQFVKGATQAAAQNGISVIIDVFRAGNTILSLLDAGAMVKPVETVETAMSHDSSFIKVGEKDGSKFDEFQHDNSPVEIFENRENLKGKKVVFRSTNGTKGLLHAKGSHQIIIGTIRNLTAVVNYCRSMHLNGYPISFVAMGSKDISRIEDVYCAKMMYFKLLEELGISNSESNSDNPLKRDWVREIKDKRLTSNHKKNDYLYSLKLDGSDLLPMFNQETGFIELL